MKETRCKGRKKRKIQHYSSSSLHIDLLSFDRTSFPQLLAASFNIENPRSRSLIKRSLRSLFSLLIQSSSVYLPHSFLSLIPLLLTPKHPYVASLSLDVVGAAALCSFEANATIASDASVVKGLVWALGSGDRRLAKSACNAVMDLSASPLGRERLREAFAIQKLLYLFCQVATFPEGPVSHLYTENATRDSSLIEYKDDNFPALVLDAAVNLINTSTAYFLDRIPENLFRETIPLLKVVLDKLQCSTSWSKTTYLWSSLKSTDCDLATVIFSISMNQDLFISWRPGDVRANIFGSETDFMNFVLNYWEGSPLLIRKPGKSLESKPSIFNSLVSSFDKATTETILSSVLNGLVSCPPIASDELDIFSFLNEVKDTLGSPIGYGQDFRVLKTLNYSSGTTHGNISKEVHFFKSNRILKFSDAGPVEKIIEAFRDGYTVALRGMEFRSDKIAALADSLAVLFGQPSVGANIYLTPAGSQGLAPHYDDHCVFVWQLFGQKQWRVSTCTASLLPRLYEPVGAVPGLKDDVCGSMQYVLNEGDILYVPRGFVHEACTTADKFSMHLTLGIEVEAPFEWEAFAHIALHCWNEEQKISFSISDANLRERRSTLVFLLHIALRLIADENPTFRKACMVAAFPLPCDTPEFKDKITFEYIIGQIDARSSFIEALKCCRLVAGEGNEDSLQWLRWLRHLPQEGDVKEKIDFYNLLPVVKDLDLVYNDHIEDAVVEFSQIKSEFCRNASFKDAHKCFMELLERYRVIRRKYMNGMLSLHSA